MPGGPLAGRELMDLVEGDSSGASLPSQGLNVDYCIFCYHGTHFLRHDNVALLTKFVSERGSILPKRFTKCCAKHQRKLAHTIKRSKWMNIIPWHSKAHPMLRFSSMKPMPTGDAHAPITKPDALDLPVSVSAGADRSLPLSTPAAASLTTALDEISQLTAARPAQA